MPDGYSLSLSGPDTLRPPARFTLNVRNTSRHPIAALFRPDACGLVVYSSDGRHQVAASDRGFNVKFQHLMVRDYRIISPGKSASTYIDLKLYGKLPRTDHGHYLLEGQVAIVADPTKLLRASPDAFVGGMPSNPKNIVPDETRATVRIPVRAQAEPKSGTGLDALIFLVVSAAMIIATVFSITLYTYLRRGI